MGPEEIRSLIVLGTFLIAGTVFSAALFYLGFCVGRMVVSTPDYRLAQQLKTQAQELQRQQSYRQHGLDFERGALGHTPVTAKMRRDAQEGYYRGRRESETADHN